MKNRPKFIVHNMYYTYIGLLVFNAVQHRGSMATRLAYDWRFTEETLQLFIKLD